MEKAPSAAGQSLIALDFLLAKTTEFAVFGVGDETDSALETVYARFLPHKVVAPSKEGEGPAPTPLLADRSAVNGRTTTYICEGFTCQAPVVGIEALAKSVDDLARVREAE